MSTEDLNLDDFATDENDLPIEDYIYTDHKQEADDKVRFHDLINLDENKRTEDDAIELLYIAKRLFYNHHGIKEIEKARAQMLAFWDVEVDDDNYTFELSGSHDLSQSKRIDDLLDDSFPLEEFNSINFNKLATKHPEIPLFKLLNLEQMVFKGKKEKSILNKAEDYCSEHPSNILFQILSDKLLARSERACNIISENFLATSLSKSLKRASIHSIEFYLVHSAIFEFLITANDLLKMDALMHCTALLFPHLEDLYEEKDVYNEMLKVQFCKETIMD